MRTYYWAEGVSTGKWHHKQRILDDTGSRSSRQVRGPTGAVMCETRDLGIKWPHWHTLIFSDEARKDMRCVCPRDVKKMLVQRAVQSTGSSGQQSTSMKS